MTNQQLAALAEYYEEQARSIRNVLRMQQEHATGTAQVQLPTKLRKAMKLRAPATDTPPQKPLTHPERSAHAKALVQQMWKQDGFATSRRLVDGLNAKGIRYSISGAGSLIMRMGGKLQGHGPQSSKWLPPTAAKTAKPGVVPTTNGHDKAATMRLLGQIAQAAGTPLRATELLTALKERGMKKVKGQALGAAVRYGYLASTGRGKHKQFAAGKQMMPA